MLPFSLSCPTPTLLPVKYKCPTCVLHTTLTQYVVTQGILSRTTLFSRGIPQHKLCLLHSMTKMKVRSILSVRHKLRKLQIIKEIYVHTYTKFRRLNKPRPNLIDKASRPKDSAIMIAIIPLRNLTGSRNKITSSKCQSTVCG